MLHHSKPFDEVSRVGRVWDKSRCLSQEERNGLDFPLALLKLCHPDQRKVSLKLSNELPVELSLAPVDPSSFVLHEQRYQLLPTRCLGNVLLRHESQVGRGFRSTVWYWTNLRASSVESGLVIGRTRGFVIGPSSTPSALVMFRSKAA